MSPKGGLGRGTARVPLPGGLVSGVRDWNSRLLYNRSAGLCRYCEEGVTVLYGSILLSPRRDG